MKQKIQRWGSIAVLSLFVGCVSPGSVRSTSSKLDGEKQVQIEPGWLYAGGMRSPQMKLGGFWTEKDPNDFVLEVVLLGLDDIESIKVGIDGKITELKPSEASTGYDYTSNVKSTSAAYDTLEALSSTPTERHLESARRFQVPLSFVEKMVAAKKVIVQVSRSRDYLEGEFSFNQTSYAKPAFRKALEKIKEVDPVN